MIYYIAIIRDSQVQTLKMASGDNEPQGLREDGATVVHIDFPIEDRLDFISRHYWDGEWIERELPPNRFAEWIDGEWIWDHEDVVNEVRSVRNKILSSCDWTRLDDNGLSQDQRDSWASYRQELRDITENLGDIKSLSDVEWPQPK
jgi:hypothetical protein